MNLDTARVRKLLKAFDFGRLFIEELGWDHYDAPLEIIFDGRTIYLEAIAEKRGMAAYQYPTPSGEQLPNHTVRRKIDQQVAKTTHEHLIVFTDAEQSTQVWQWVRREPGKPIACREHTFHKTQPGDALIQKLQAIAFSLEEEENLTLLDVTRRARAGFDVDRLTKRFYDRFKKEHTAFLKFVSGIKDKTDHEWYASVMLNRLMFVYFIQRKGFLDGDTDYLRNRLVRMKREYGQDKFYSFYRYFLLRLFHEGLGGKTRTHELEKLLGRIPYFDGGFFERHPVEQRYTDIQIPDEAFERIFDYFDQYQWHLDERPLRADNEINPDVLGYIFEKYINQKQMGAYYTKEDITEYISKNTVIPFLFDAARSKCKVAFENPGGPTIWSLLSADPDRYLYQAVKHGVIRKDGSVLPEADLPDFVQTGMHDPKARMFDNRYNLQQAPADDSIRLVTETWREYVNRRNRCLEIREKLQNGGVNEINDLITFNIDIRQFAQDVIENCEGPELLRAFWHTINGHIPEKSNERYQNGITILDPTCGSGAFLFAALNILESLYEACLDRMAAFVEDLNRSNKKCRPEKFSDFRKVLKQVEDHPNRRYYIFKNIILNNLFGVDIMEEAVEICKLRLFLKLVAQVEPDSNKENFGIEPLPDIDFNIRAGNTLVGYATADEVRKVFIENPSGKQAQKKLMLGETQTEYDRFEEQVELTDSAFKQFRRMQADLDMDAKDFSNAKQKLRKRLKTLDDELNRHLAKEYGVKVEKKIDYEKWLKSHQPFHWFVEFYGIMQSGGLDVIIGNPPYVSYPSKAYHYTVKGYATIRCADLFTLVMERAISSLVPNGQCGLIIRLSSASNPSMKSLRQLLFDSGMHMWISFYSASAQPACLFEGVRDRLSIYVLSLKSGSNSHPLRTTRFLKWFSEERQQLFATNLCYEVTPNHNLEFISKIGSAIEASVYNKVRKQNSISKFINSHGRYILYYHESPVHWQKAWPRVPYFFTEAQGVKRSVSVRELKFDRKVFLDAMICMGNSSLLYWFYNTVSDCRHLTMGVYSRLGFSINRLREETVDKLTTLAKKLMQNYNSNKQRYIRFSQQTGRSEFDAFYPAKSKPIIDQIDQVLAKHYGLNDEELDFIINYDIKYRMGRGADGAEEDS